MKKFLLAASFIAAFGLSSGSALADVKIGLVDMNRIFSEYTKTKEAEKSLNEARAEAKKELDSRVEDYKKRLEEIDKLNKELNKPELSKEAQTKKTKERDDKIGALKELEREIGEFRTSRDKSFQEQAVRMRDGIVKKITEVIKEKVKSDQYDLVLDKSGMSMHGVPVVLYSKDTADFSQSVIDTLNKEDGGSAASTEKAAPAKKK